MNTPFQKETIFEHFAGRSTPLQRNLLNEWLKEPTNRELYYQWLEEWERTNWQLVTNDDIEFDKLLARIDQASADADSETGRNVSLLPRWFQGRFLAVAAVLVVFFMTGLYLSRSWWMYQTVVTGYGEIHQERLADGTLVTLNANSSLTIPRFDLGQGAREVWLRGEAEFNVARQPDRRRFVVKTDDDFDVEVLGTEFVVYTRNNTNRVALQKGRVKINYRSGKQLNLRPGDIVSLDETTGRLKIAKTGRPQQFSEWKHHRYHFDNTPVADVLKLLQDQFGVQVALADSTLSEQRISGQFKAQTASELIQALETILDLRAIHQGNHIELQPVDTLQ
ncbi:FecR family protein [Larkinella arboricola]|uniref:FecR family protein n=1 Tax=Larkinella arboricola TaxID=643671 RepID=A0A327WVU1_LARAB|nr:FecR domain-containing protein [Larkinella arboricola]RAJ93220.1 FecR family protein [Larkinella arboricola]